MRGGPKNAERADGGLRGGGGMGYGQGMRKWIGALGEGVLVRLGSAARLAGTLFAVVWKGLQPKTWTPPFRSVLARQVLFTGYEATGFVALIALLSGLLAVVEADIWLNKLGQAALIGPVLVTVIIRELGPLLTNFAVIARSGTAISTELANMKVNGEVRALDAMGLDPFVYLVVPRVLGVAASTFCLTVVFTAVSLLGGFACLWTMEWGGLALGRFFSNILGAIGPADVWMLVAKSVLPGMLTGACCCEEGLSVGTAVTEVPIAAARGVIRSIAALFVSSVLISVAAYL